MVMFKAFRSTSFRIQMLSLKIISILAFVSTNDGANISSGTNSNGCIVPEQPEHGSILSAKIQSGDKVENGVALEYDCDGGFRPNGSSTSICNNGKWSLDSLECIEACISLTWDHTIELSCTLNKENIDCDTPINGTIAKINCAPFYENEEISNYVLRRCEGSEWNAEIPSCSEVCGVDPAIDGRLERPYPWNVLIYQKGFTELGPSCAGTLIHEKLVLTAASCITVESLVKKVIFEEILVVAGQTEAKYENPDPGSEVQHSIGGSMYVPETYDGVLGKLDSDIALVTLWSPFKLNKFIYPACIDWTNQYKRVFRGSFLSGKVSTPRSPKSSDNSSKMIEIDVSLLSDYKCRHFLETITNENLNFYFVTNDKYCAENITSTYNAPDCNNRIYQGAGLIKKNLFNGKFYVMGVASVGSVHNNCYNNAFTLFTIVSNYISFISEKLSRYSGAHLQIRETTCGYEFRDPMWETPLILNRKVVQRGNYPWQVDLYKVHDSEKTLICRGTLIDQRVILTAAQCVTNQQKDKLPPENYMLVIERDNYKRGDAKDHRYGIKCTDCKQYSPLKEIILPTQYKDKLHNYSGDIAILVPETSFNFSIDFVPICMDWESKKENQFGKPNISGFVAGWKFKPETPNSTKPLIALKVPYLDTEQCKKEIPSNFNFLLTSDKFCSRFKDKSICTGYAGSGLFSTDKKGTYYLAGIKSLTPQSGGCQNQSYGLYTQVSKYIKKFILKSARSY